ncbi:hypothetical protein NDU88_006458, partial [Pleurodeles waltl]
QRRSGGLLLGKCCTGAFKCCSIPCTKGGKTSHGGHSSVPWHNWEDLPSKKS